VANFKEKYKNLWGVSKKREIKVRTLLEMWCLSVVKFGFEAESDKFNPNYAEEQGIPDYIITNIDPNITIEVTGTNSKHVSEKNAIWVRPDKVKYAENHPEVECWLAHVIDSINLIRFIRLKTCAFAPIQDKLKDEKYHIVPADKMLSVLEFKKIIFSRI